VTDFILKQSMNKEYSLDWQHSNETLKEGKLVTYLFLKNNLRLEKYLILLKSEYRKPLCRCVDYVYQRTDFS
jgi:hypothetical protein